MLPKILSAQYGVKRTDEGTENYNNASSILKNVIERYAWLWYLLCARRSNVHTVYLSRAESLFGIFNNTLIFVSLRILTSVSSW